MRLCLSRLGFVPCVHGPVNLAARICGSGCGAPLASPWRVTVGTAIVVYLFSRRWVVEGVTRRAVRG